MMAEKEMRLLIPLDKKPDYVCVDPEFKVFKVLNYELPPDELMKLLKSEHIYCKILAARGLSKFRSSRVVKALKEFILNESFWGTQAEAVRTLGNLKLDDALNALIELEEKIKHPRVRRAIADALGNYKEEKAAKVLVKMLENNDESYYVRQSAATSLGKTRWDGAFEHLKKALDVPSHNYVITIGAIRGLSEIGGDEAFNVIKGYTKKGKPTLVRAAAIMALARFPEKKEAKETIQESLFDDNFRIRVSAVLAIKELLDPTFLPLLDKVSNEDLFERVRRYAREVATKIRKFMEKGAEYQKLREEIDKIREENRKLLDTVAKLEAKLKIRDAMLVAWSKTKQDFQAASVIIGCIPWCKLPEIIKVFWLAFVFGLLGVTTIACIYKLNCFVICIGALSLVIGILSPIYFGCKLKKILDNEPSSWDDKSSETGQNSQSE